MAAPDFKITKRRIRNHFHYFWWQYAILACAAVLGWNLLYTTTHYRSPEHLKIEWYYEGVSGVNADALANELLAQVTPELFPDMEEVTYTLVGMDEQYGEMQLLVWSAAGQGDLYMLPKDSFSSLAASGVMADLQPYIDSGVLNVEGIDLSSGYIADEETGTKVLVGIPTDSLTKLADYELDCKGKYMGLLVIGGNLDNAAKLMGYFLDNLQ